MPGRTDRAAYGSTCQGYLGPLEAYAASATPVATTTGGLAEQVTDGTTGFTTAPANPASLARAIHRAFGGQDWRQATRPSGSPCGNAVALVALDVAH